MMRKVTLKRTLFYYNCIQIFEAIDSIGGHYLALLVDDGGTHDQYLVVGVSPENLRLFRLGEIDLLEVILGRDLEDWFILKNTRGLDEELELQVQTGEITEAFLPEAGFLLSAPPDDAEIVTIESSARNNAILEVKLDPPEAARDPRIHATTLAGMISLVQTLVKHAYNKALAGLTDQTRKGLDVKDAHQLDAVILAPGSFRILFEASKGPDLLGFVELQRALGKLDELTDYADTPNKALEVIKNNKGHLAGAYIRLLEFLIRNQTAFSYQWSVPASLEIGGRLITKKQAGPLLEIFSKEEELGVEVIELHGYLRKADSKNNTWRLESVEDGQEYSGEVKEGSAGLSNLVIDRIYRFQCEEQLSEQPATGKEIRKLFLIECHDEEE